MHCCIRKQELYASTMWRRGRKKKIQQKSEKDVVNISRPAYEALRERLSLGPEHRASWALAADVGSEIASLWARRGQAAVRPPRREKAADAFW